MNGPLSLENRVDAIVSEPCDNFETACTCEVTVAPGACAQLSFDLDGLRHYTYKRHVRTGWEHLQRQRAVKPCPVCKPEQFARWQAGGYRPTFGWVPRRRGRGKRAA